MTIRALYSIPELASLAGVSDDTIRRMMARLGIEPVMLGRKQYVPLSELLSKLPTFAESIKAAEKAHKANKSTPQTDAK